MVIYTEIDTGSQRNTQQFNMLSRTQQKTLKKIKLFRKYKKCQLFKQYKFGNSALYADF